jgi:hypothetical protein
MSWSNLEGAAGALEEGRHVTPELTGADGLLGAGGRHVTPELVGAAAFGALKGDDADVLPLITGADVVLGELKGDDADVLPRITGALLFA